MVTSTVDPIQTGVHDICVKAADVFKRNAASHYVEVDAALSYDRLADSSDKESCAVEPLNFLIGPKEERQQVWAKPFVAIVTGQYGVGKTELARQLAVREGEAAVFPIALARCDARVRPLLKKRPLEPDEMFQFLFGNHVPSRELKGKAAENLWRPIQEGRVLLILDGLDELIYDRQSHKHFFKSLADTLFNIEEKEDYWLGFRVVVTLRLEYLSAYDNFGGLEAVDCLKKGKVNRKRFSVPFLQLDYLRIHLIRRALVENFGARPAAEIEQHRALMNLLDRPLILRIFCEYAQQDKNFLNNLKRVRTGADVIERYLCAFLEAAGADRQLREAQNAITPDVCWDLDAIAQLALLLYRTPHRESFGQKEIAACARSTQKGGRVAESVAWEAISKCPFMVRDADSLRFENRTFFDYFVARGMFLKSKETSSTGFTEFDEVFLNLDIRKLLRTIMDENWYPRTKSSCALDRARLPQWDPTCGLVRPTPALLKELEAERRSLLDMMTCPEHFKAEIAVKTIRRFLDRPLKQFHPRYLMYNLDAVAVYIRVNAWDEMVQTLDSHFCEFLGKLLKDLEKRLPLSKDSVHARELQEAYELLVVRILHIAHEMQYAWFRDYKKWAADDRFGKDIGMTRPELAAERKGIFSS
jgi:hypothetical protein